MQEPKPRPRPLFPHVNVFWSLENGQTGRLPAFERTDFIAESKNKQ